jgi:RND family efflux transporter MFP subunit
LSFLLSGCGADAAADSPGARSAPQVTVAAALLRKVAESAEFTGRFEAVEGVEIRPRVSGYVSRVAFSEGSDVRKGTVLFVIDPRPYRAERDRAAAQLAQARAQLVLARSERERATKLLAQHAISREEYDTRFAQREEAEASVAAAQATLDAATLNLGFTRVTAPISGRISRARVTRGNFVNSGQTVLTTLVSLDPIYVSFDGDEQEYLEYIEQARATAGTSNAPRSRVQVGLANESDYPHSGTLVFVDNALDPMTGTIRSRALLANPDRRFTPGLFARIKLIGSSQRDAVLVNDSAIGTDQTERYVLVLAKGNRLESRPVRLGPLVDGLRLVEAGLHAGELVVVNGLQRVRPGAEVSPLRAAMGEGPPDEKARLIARNGSVPEGVRQ